MTKTATIKVLDQGYVKMIEPWGSDERIIESARMSTAKGFLGWGSGGDEQCYENHNIETTCKRGTKSCHLSHEYKPGDEKLLKFLWDKKHHTPFEMAGLVIEVKAPLMVFREWHRHRTQSYNEMSARYVPLPDENYLPTLDRCMTGNAKALSSANRQAQGSGVALREEDALDWLASLADVYDHAQRVYARGIEIGIPKELARLPVPVARYSAMRASANLRNWLGFLLLRCAPDAQWEIVQFANAVAAILKEHFPRVYEVAAESMGLPK